MKNFKNLFGMDAEFEQRAELGRLYDQHIDLMTHTSRGRVESQHKETFDFMFADEKLGEKFEATKERFIEAFANTKPEYAQTALAKSFYKQQMGHMKKRA